MLDCLDHHGLMPDEPLAPQAPPYHAVRSQWSRSRLSAQLLLAGLTLLDRCGQQALSERVLKGWLNRNPTNITLLSDLASRRLAVGDNVEGFMHRIWSVVDNFEVPQSVGVTMHIRDEEDGWNQRY